MKFFKNRAVTLAFFAAAALAFAACAYEYPEPFELDGSWEPATGVPSGTVTISFEFRNAIIGDPDTIARAETALDTLKETTGYYSNPAYTALGSDNSFWTGKFANYSAYGVTVSVPGMIEFGGDFGLEEGKEGATTCVQMFNRINLTDAIKAEIDNGANYNWTLANGWYSVLDLAEIVAADDGNGGVASKRAEDAKKLLSSSGIASLSIWRMLSSYGYSWNGNVNASDFEYYSHYKSTNSASSANNIDADDVIQISGNPSPLKKK